MCMGLVVECDATTGTTGSGMAQCNIWDWLTLSSKNIVLSKWKNCFWRSSISLLVTAQAWFSKRIKSLLFYSYSTPTQNDATQDQLATDIALDYRPELCRLLFVVLSRDIPWAPSVKESKMWDFARNESKSRLKSTGVDEHGFRASGLWQDGVARL